MKLMSNKNIDKLHKIIDSINVLIEEEKLLMKSRKGGDDLTEFYSTGWVCPKCSMSNSPDNLTCSCSTTSITRLYLIADEANEVYKVSATKEGKRFHLGCYEKYKDAYARLEYFDDTEISL